MVAPLSRCTVGRRLLSILALWAVTFPGAVLADSLWIVEPARDAVVEAHDVETLLRDLLRYDTATTHIVGLSEVETRMRRQRSSPDCLTGLESCDPARGVLTDWLEIDRTLVVEPLGTGRQLRVTERITGERQTRTLTVETDSLRESLLRVVSELQQTEAIVDIRTQPSGATVRHGDRVVGQTPLDQVRLPPATFAFAWKPRDMHPWSSKRSYGPASAERYVENSDGSSPPCSSRRPRLPRSFTWATPSKRLPSERPFA